MLYWNSKVTYNMEQTNEKAITSYTQKKISIVTDKKEQWSNNYWKL